jgi:hypothetical protein
VVIIIATSSVSTSHRSLSSVLYQGVAPYVNETEFISFVFGVTDQLQVIFSCIRHMLEKSLEYSEPAH